MATKKAVQKETNPIVLDESFEFEDSKLRIVLDARDFYTNVDAYYDRLLFSRGIPTDRENLSPKDPVVMIALENIAWVKDGKKRAMMALDMAKRHYTSLAEEAYREALFLALTAHSDNKFDFFPEPYSPAQSKSSLPGMEDETPLPMPKRDITNPVERRLKQIFDVMGRDISILQKFQEAMTQSAILMGVEEKDDAGFQSA